MTVRFQLLFGCALLLFFGGCRKPAQSQSGQPARSQPKLVEVASVPMKMAREVAIVGTRAYVSQNFEGMTIVDVADPARPTIIKTLTPDFVQPLHLVPRSERMLVLADRFRGLVLMDISTPDQPTTTAQLLLPGVATHVDVFERAGRSFAAVACGGAGVCVVEITDETSPTLVGRFNFDIDYSRRIAVKDNIAYLADNLDGGFKLISLADPATPELLLKVALHGFYDAVKIVDDIAYIGCRQYGTRIFRIARATTDTDDLVTTPSFELLSSILRSKDRVRDVALVDDLMLVANDVAGVDLYDVSKLTAPVLVDEWRLPANNDPHKQFTAMSCAVRSNYALIPAWDAGLVVLRFR